MKFLNNMILAAVAICALSVTATHAKVNLTPENTKITLSKKLSNSRAPLEITDQFNHEGSVYAYVTFVWDEKDKSIWDTPVTAKWYSGEKLLSTKELKTNLSKSPFHFWFRMKAVAFNNGPARVEIYSGEKLLGSKAFTVSDGASSKVAQ